jgi:asparagine synthase (glutamine-hydrolysing)
MSGFVAVLARGGERVDESMFATLAAALSTYGPDELAVRHDGPAAVAHALFRVRENSGAGPHQSVRGTWLAGDVRVDAQDELRRLLRAAGAVVPVDATDESLFLAAWDSWGTDAFARIRGDFSAVIWDAAQGAMCAVRDAFGVRPLYYAFVNGQFVCSNVPAAVRAMPGVSSRLHEPAVVSFLQWGSNVDLTTTTFADIRRLAPAHQLLVPAGSVKGEPRRFWNFPEPPPLVYRRDEEYVEHYLRLMGDAVSDRLRQPSVAIALSGGLDSTAIAATARRVSPDTDIQAYTWVNSPLLPDAEGDIAALTARRLGIQHHLIDNPPPSLAHLDSDGIRSPEPLDMPDASTWLSAAGRIAQRSRVLLVGEDGDALFLPPSMRMQFRSWPMLDVLWRATRYALSNGRFPHTGLRLRDKIFGGPQLMSFPVPPWVRADLAARVGPQAEATFPPHPTRPETHAALLVAQWQAMLAEYDRALTHAPLEVRWPLLDVRLLEFVLAIPPIPWCQRKYLVRRAFRGALPDAVLKRPKTGVAGFTEMQVVRWLASRPKLASGFDERMGAFVDAAGVRSAMISGSMPETMAAWRAIQFDHWLSHL